MTYLVSIHRAVCAESEFSMVKKVYSVRDAKAEVFHHPMMYLSHGEAERALKLALGNPETMYAKFPEDYDLYYLGVFDDVHGKFDLLDSPQHMMKVVQLKSDGQMLAQ